MWRLRVTLLCVTAVTLPLRAQAVSLSGIMIYAAEQSGDPKSWDAIAPESGNQLLWHTQMDGIWPGLGILAGSSPQSLEGALLNAPDFTVDIPLAMGANDFMFVGEPDEKPSGNQFDNFVLNLYFDGDLDAPGISVLFPRRGWAEGDIPESTRSNRVFTLAVAESSRRAPATAYDNRSVRVSVDAVSFGPAQWPLLVNRVSASTPSPGGGNDWIGVLALFVEASAAPPAGRAGGGGLGLQGGRIDAGGSVRVGPDSSGSAGATTRQESGSATRAPSREGPPVDGQAAAGAMAAEPTEAATPPAKPATPNSTATPVGTAGHDGARLTPTARATALASTPTRKPSPTGITSTQGTPTPALQLPPSATQTKH